MCKETFRRYHYSELTGVSYTIICSVKCIIVRLGKTSDDCFQNGNSRKLFKVAEEHV